MLRLAVGLAMALCGSAQAATAPCPVVVIGACPLGVMDVVGARALSMGAYRGVTAGNDGIFLNAASLAARKRYSIETTFFMERLGSDATVQALNGSVVDSETTGVTSGFAYTRALAGPWNGNVFQVPLAFPVTSSLFLGFTGKFLQIDGPLGESVRSGNLDVSGFFRSSGGLAVGVSGYNLLDSGHVTQMPRRFGAGVSYGDDRRYNLAADWRADFTTRGQTTHLFAFGAEYLLGDSVPIRASYLNDDTRSASAWAVGAGLVSASGLAIDLAYRQGIERTDDRTFAVTLKLFLSSR
jgi:hypothetical protein